MSMNFVVFLISDFGITTRNFLPESFSISTVLDSTVFLPHNSECVRICAVSAKIPAAAIADIKIDRIFFIAFRVCESGYSDRKNGAPQTKNSGGAMLYG